MRQLVGTLAGLAEVAAARGCPTRAARLLRAVQAQVETAGAPLTPAERACYERALAVVGPGDGAPRAAGAWDEDRVLPLEEAVGYALEGLEVGESAAPPASGEGR